MSSLSAAWLGGGHGGAGGTEVIEQLRKPTALVCSSRTPEATLARARGDEQLLESTRLCIARGGTVLIPVDSSARVLELAYLLEHAWRTEVAKDNHVFKSTKLYFGRSQRRQHHAQRAEYAGVDGRQHCQGV